MYIHIYRFVLTTNIHQATGANPTPFLCIQMLLPVIVKCQWQLNQSQSGMKWTEPQVSKVSKLILLTIIQMLLPVIVKCQWQLNQSQSGMKWTEPQASKVSKLILLTIAWILDRECHLIQCCSHTVGILVGPLLGGLVLAAVLVCCVCLTVWYIKMLRRRKRLWRITQVATIKHSIVKLFASISFRLIFVMSVCLIRCMSWCHLVVMGP